MPVKNFDIVRIYGVKKFGVLAKARVILEAPK